MEVKMENTKLKKLSKVELIDKAMLKIVAGGNCSDGCYEWEEDCGCEEGGSYDDCGQIVDICNMSDINSR